MPSNVCTLVLFIIIGKVVSRVVTRSSAKAVKAAKATDMPSGTRLHLFL